MPFTTKRAVHVEKERKKRINERRNAKHISHLLFFFLLVRIVSTVHSNKLTEILTEGENV